MESGAKHCNEWDRNEWDRNEWDRNEWDRNEWDRNDWDRLMLSTGQARRWQ